MELVQEILGWCSLINVALLLIWFLFIMPPEEGLNSGLNERHTE